MGRIQGQPKIAEFIWSENGRDLVRELRELMTDSEYARLRNEYQRLGHEVLGFAVETYNRLIDYAKTEKRQFWLNKQRFDGVNPAQSAIGFRATVSAEGARLPGEIRFDPFTKVIKRTVILDVKQKLDGASGRIRHAIHYEDYDTIQDYLDTRSKPRAVLELVANR